MTREEMERLEYLERAFKEMGNCYDHVSQRCIDAEESVMWLGKLACLIDKQKMEMWHQLVEMASEIKDYPLSDVPMGEVMACINKHFPELKEELEDK